MENSWLKESIEFITKEKPINLYEERVEFHVLLRTHEFEGNLKATEYLKIQMLEKLSVGKKTLEV